MELLNWLKENNEALTLIGGAITVVVGAGWAVFTFVDDKRKSKKGDQVQYIYNYGIPLEQYEARMRQREAQIRDEIKDAAPGSSRVGELEREKESLQIELAEKRQKFDDVFKQLEQLKLDLMPPELDWSVFPKEMKVLDFSKGNFLKVRYRTTFQEVIAMIIFMIIWSSGFFGILFYKGFGLPIWFVVPIILAFFFWRIRRWYIKWDFIKQQVTLVNPGSYHLNTTAFPVKIGSIQKGEKWIAECKYGKLTIATSSERLNEAEARAELLPFVGSINWEMGIPVLSDEMFKKNKAR